MAQPAGDSFDAAFPDLFMRCYRLAYRMLGDQAAAEDVAADAMAKALVHWSRVSALPYRDGWVLKVAGNLAIRASKKLRQPIPTALAARTHVADAATSATDAIALAAAVRTLPKRQREAVVLRFLTGLTEREVARSLGVSVGAVKTHIHRALEALRERLGNDVEEELVALAVD